MDLEFEKNKDHNSLLLNELEQLMGTIKKGGGKARLEKIKTAGKMTARERIDYLVDAKAPVHEIGGFAAHGMYEEDGGCPSAGVVVVLSKVAERWCVIVANDASVKAGAWFPMTAKKNLRAQEISLENKIPIIYLVDSAGVYLPMQDEIFPDKDDFGRIFRNNAQLSSAGVVQIAAVMGSCVAGGAYLPIMSDEAIIVDGSASIFLAGSYLVKAAIGETIDNETLGGATTHTAISGVGDYKAVNDHDALDRIRQLMGKMGAVPQAGFSKVEPKAPKTSPETILGLLPAQNNKPYDTFSILDCLVDEGSVEEYKADYGKSLITAYARIDGWAVGIVANQRKMVKNAKGELQFGGVIYSDSADKATRFIANCNQRKIPLVFLQDVTGFMVGSKAEHGGIIKDGAKMVNAVANSVVPKFTVVMGNSFGAGNYAMCGRAYDPRMMVAWPNAKLAVMGGQQAANVLLQIEKSKLKKEGKKISAAKEKELLQRIEQRYEKQTKPLYAAARLWTDAIISPSATRSWISSGIAMANNAPIEKQFNMGVLQV